MERPSAQDESPGTNDASSLQRDDAVISAGQDAPKRGLLAPLLSAAVFGVIGAFIGRALGGAGANADRNLSKPFFTWGLGGLFALISGYSAYESQPKANKTVARAMEPAASDTPPYANVSNSIPIAKPPVSKPLPPQPSIQADGMQRDGLLDKNATQQLA
jgi:hypothetical protein